jgi:Uma2 family endonuclease
VELLFGKIIAKIPEEEPHADILSDVADFFRERLGTKYKFRSQSPVTLPNDSEPEPDFAVVVRRKYNKESETYPPRTRT